MNCWHAIFALMTVPDAVPGIVLVIVGVPLLLVGAEWLVRGAVEISQRLRVSTLVIGLTIVAAGTSAPELVINVMAAVAGNPGLSFGNVIGSNIANIGLIIGIGALLTPMFVHNRVIRMELPWLVVISGLMVLLAVPIGWLGMADGFGRLEGIIMIAGFVLVLSLWFRAARIPEGTPVTKEMISKARESTSMSFLGAGGLFFVGLAVLLVGGRLTELGAVQIASQLGMSHAIIGMTILAIATSLPELITVVVACRRGHTDLAVGNVVGSNLFNILLVMGVTATIADIPVPGAAGWQDLAAMMVFSLLLWRFCVTQNQRILRWEGAALLGLYIAYIAWGVLRDLMYHTAISNAA